MERVLDEFKSRNKNKPTKKSSPFPTAGVKQTADDQWDKEDIEDIEGLLHFKNNFISFLPNFLNLTRFIYSWTVCGHWR